MADLIVLHGEGRPRPRKTKHGKVVIEVEIEQEHGRCHHSQTVFSLRKRTCECKECGAQLDVYELLDKMWQYSKRLQQRLEKAREIEDRELERQRNGWTEKEQKRAEQKRKRTHFRRKGVDTWHRTTRLKPRFAEAKCGASAMRRECEWSEHEPEGPLCVECFGRSA